MDKFFVSRNLFLHKTWYSEQWKIKKIKTCYWPIHVTYKLKKFTKKITKSKLNLKLKISSEDPVT